MAHPENVKEEVVEQAEIDAYMDPENANGDGPTNEERKGYLKARYEQVKNDYKALCLQREEFEGQKRADLQGKIQEAFKQNYVARKWFVRELRKAGEKIEDKFVPA